MLLPGLVLAALEPDSGHPARKPSSNVPHSLPEPISLVLRLYSLLPRVLKQVSISIVEYVPQVFPSCVPRLAYPLRRVDLLSAHRTVFVSALNQLHDAHRVENVAAM